MECLGVGLFLAGYSYFLLYLWSMGNDFYRHYTYVRDEEDDELALFRLLRLAPKYKPTSRSPEHSAPEVMIPAQAPHAILHLEHNPRKKLIGTRGSELKRSRRRLNAAPIIIMKN